MCADTKEQRRMVSRQEPAHPGLVCEENAVGEQRKVEVCWVRLAQCDVLSSMG